MTAVVLMTIMLGVGLAVMTTADVQSAQSRNERVRESAFNLAEGLLQAESVVLQNNWPSTPPCGGGNTCGYAWSAADPNVCTETTAPSNPTQCPSTTALAGVFSNVDQARTPVTWRIQVRDDLGVCLSNPPGGYSAFYNSCQVPTYYKGICPLRSTPTNPALCWPAVASNFSTDANNAPGDDQTSCTSAALPVACTWDNNGNKQLWVRVDATIGTGKEAHTRSLVALLHLENFPVNLNSKDAVNGGAITFPNNGNKNIIDASGSRIVARCDPTTGATPNLGTIMTTALALPAVAGTPAISVTNGGAAGFQVGQTLALGVGLLNASTYEVHKISNIVAGTAGLPDVITFDSNLSVNHIAGEKVQLAPPPPGDNTNNNCESWIGQSLPGQNADKHQLNPPWAYISDPNYPTFLSPTTFKAVVAGLKHWTTCPTTDADWVGGVYIQSVPDGTTCTVPNHQINTHAAPGFIFVDTQAPSGHCTSNTKNNPALSVGSSTVYYGVIYMANNQGCSYGDTIMTVSAGAQIDGGVSVDGHAIVDIGNASNSGQCPVQGGTSPNFFCPTIKFDPVEFGGITATGAAGLVQNTWRELAPGQ